eukprot:679946-Pleurochrysis_carterae.AAC.1
MAVISDCMRWVRKYPYKYHGFMKRSANVALNLSNGHRRRKCFDLSRTAKEPRYYRRKKHSGRDALFAIDVSRG